MVRHHSSTTASTLNGIYSSSDSGNWPLFPWTSPMHRRGPGPGLRRIRDSEGRLRCYCEEGKRSCRDRLRRRYYAGLLGQGLCRGQLESHRLGAFRLVVPLVYPLVYQTMWKDFHLFEAEGASEINEMIYRVESRIASNPFMAWGVREQMWRMSKLFLVYQKSSRLNIFGCSFYFSAKQTM